jgi:hypothetical protein
MPGPQQLLGLGLQPECQPVALQVLELLLLLLVRTLLQLVVTLTHLRALGHAPQLLVLLLLWCPAAVAPAHGCCQLEAQDHGRPRLCCWAEQKGAEALAALFVDDLCLDVLH